MGGTKIEMDPEIREFLLTSPPWEPKIQLDGRTYTLQEPIGSGFKAVVWRATDRRGRQRAIKFAVAADYEDTSWLSELDYAASLEQHSVFARLEDAGATELDLGDLGTHPFVFFIEEYVDGVPLREFLESRPEDVPPSFLLQYAQDLTDALQALDALNLAHDDLHSGNVIIGPPPVGKDPDELVVRVIDMGSVKRADKVVKEKTDLDWVTEQLVDIHNVIVRSRTAGVRDLRFLSAAKEVLRSIVEPDRSIALSRPNAIKDAFIRADSRASWVPRSGGRRITSPFEFLSSEHIADEHTFVQLFAESPWLDKVVVRDPVLLTGPRGCGKSTLFRWLSLKTQVGLDQPSFQRWPIAGFFISCSSELEGRLSWLNRSEDPDAEKALVAQHEASILHYFNLVLAKEVIETLLEMQRTTDRFGLWHIGVHEETKVLTFLRESLGARQPSLEGVSRLRQALDLVERQRVHCDVAMRHSAELAGLTTEAFLSDFTAMLAELLPFLRDHKITFLVDDFTLRRVNKHIQQVLNRTIWPRRDSHVFKVSSEKLGVELTDTRGRVLETTRELIVVDVGYEFVSLADDGRLREARAFAKQLLDNRLKAAEYNANAEQLIGPSDWSEYRTLDRALRNGTGRSQYHGLECIADLCSGDISNLLGIYRRIFEFGRVRQATATSVPKGTQHRAIKAVSGEQVDLIATHFPLGVEMRDLVMEFGTLVANVLRDGAMVKKDDQYVPPAIPRIEVDDPASVDAILNEQSRALADELIRRAIFIQMTPGRGRREHVQTVRWQLRRLYLPHFGAALNKSRALILDEPEDFRFFLSEPRQACENFWRREPRAAEDRSQRLKRLRRSDDGSLRLFHEEAEDDRASDEVHSD